MTGKTLRATLLTASITAMTLGMAMLSQPADALHMTHVLGALLLLTGGILAFVREQVKEDQLAKVFVQKKDLDCEEKPPNP